MNLTSILRQMTAKKLAKSVLELGAIIGIIYGVSAWQAKDMLSSDGSHRIDAMRLVSLQGKVHSLYEPKRRTLVYFWAPWCSICAVSIGSLNNVDEEDFDIVTIAMDFEDLESVQAFVDKHQVQNRVLLGNEQLRQQFKIRGYPSYYLLDENANVVAKSYGLNTAIGIKLKDWASRIDPGI